MTASFKRTWLGKAAVAAALAVVFTTAIAAPAAKADPYHGRGRGHYYNDRDWRSHERNARQRVVVVHPRAPVVYTPPVVVAPPQPAGLSLFFPLNYY